MDNTNPNDMCCYRHRLYCYCVDCQAFDDLNHEEVFWVDLWTSGVLKVNKAAVPALIGEMANWLAQ